MAYGRNVEKVARGGGTEGSNFQRMNQRDCRRWEKSVGWRKLGERTRIEERASGSRIQEQRAVGLRYLRSIDTEDELWRSDVVPSLSRRRDIITADFAEHI